MPKPDKPPARPAAEKGAADFRRITIRESGTMASTWEIEALSTRRGVEVSIYDGPWMYHNGTSRRSCRIKHKALDMDRYEAMAEELFRLGFLSWDGFNESDPDVLDGTMFYMEAELADGTTIYAHGSNSYPENYDKVLRLLTEAAE